MSFDLGRNAKLNEVHLNCKHLLTPIPHFPLLSRIDRGILDTSHAEPHEKVSDAFQYRIEVEGGACRLAVWKGVVHEVIHQTPLDDEVAIASRNSEPFDLYGEGLEWHEVLDNGFGKTYRRADMERFALWSYAMDYNTFGTMAFHEVMWG